jgi:nicotinate-nucleotide--dimethylbenzimidazole phosphoribosyltransferase
MMPFRIVPTADAGLERELVARIDAKTKPRGALGRLETLALQLGLIRHTLRPAINAPRLFVFAADHGVSAEGVSAYPQQVTAQMVMNYLTGGAAVNVFARTNGFALAVIDAGVNHEFAPHPDLIDRKIARGTRNLATVPAMTIAQAEAAIAAGAALAREAAAGGSSLIAFGEMGIGNTTAASALMARFTGLPLAQCVGRGTGIDDAGLARKSAVIERALALHANARTPIEALAALGGFEIAMMMGAMLAAAEARMVILIDGFIVGAALLAAQALYPRVLDYCVFAHASDENGHAALLAHFGAVPLLSLGLRLGEGSGAALALPLVRAAAGFLCDMASFSDAGVSTAHAPAAPGLPA